MMKEIVVVCHHGENDSPMSRKYADGIQVSPSVRVSHGTSQREGSFHRSGRILACQSTVIV